MFAPLSGWDVQRELVSDSAVWAALAAWTESSYEQQFAKSEQNGKYLGK